MSNEVPNIPQCQICGQDMILKPAGVSRKTGKAYGAFWACPTRHDLPPRAPQATTSDFHMQSIQTDQFLTKTQYNEILDKQRAAFREMQAKVDECVKQVEYFKELWKLRNPDAGEIHADQIEEIPIIKPEEQADSMAAALGIK